MLVVECVASLDAVVYSTQGVLKALKRVFSLLNVNVNLLLPHTVQAKEAIALSAERDHLMSGRLTFSLDRAKYRLIGTLRLPRPLPHSLLCLARRR